MFMMHSGSACNVFRFVFFSRSDFCKKELSEQIFPRKVARLNANILYLCYTQRVKLNALCPTHTLENIQRLLSPDFSDLGRIGAVDVSDGFRDIDSQLLQDLLTGGDDKSDGKLSFFCDYTFCSIFCHEKSYEKAKGLSPDGFIKNLVGIRTLLEI